ncbi:hypothetical protein ACBJ59_12310 [Nonomuraea sp. MTCD27]|uniref:hypothetical protein n=1 Tax=Nonomuraea sp. MTCD27 TaxID=1676747 RepID=UPI0035C02204
MSVAGWIRPWFPAGLVGHIYRDCARLLKWVSEPVEGPGWLDPRADSEARSRGYFTNTRTCPDCLTRYDPKLAAELGVTDD